ncbi:MAG: hypothetical protein AYK19_18460 [Theionarchaea archaeon DG-70-1]|nr:MAG: hypothetical protein AYK19_18460 [Theionarchaea archaeon DG-70-1]
MQREEVKEDRYKIMRILGRTSIWVSKWIFERLELDQRYFFRERFINKYFFEYGFHQGFLYGNPFYTSVFVDF